ncbi:unnamed protein product [Penicillium nalgiovense]|nr:hypothetical protein NUH16_003831 [Penicillium rubens]KAJ5284909.1 hypothetical protein N7524_000215 [Penicillium chrysogenum]CAG8004871.1 unnamed protein product [Penicillium nalgiovense]
MDTLTDEQFQRLLDGIDQSSGPGPFDSLFDPTLLPLEACDDGIFSCFPPLPPIEEEVPSLSDIPALEDDKTVSSIATSVPDDDEALSMMPSIQHLLDQQKDQLEKLRLEVEALRTTLETIRKYHLESLNPWIDQVTETLKKLGGMLDETPASATDGEFDINI